MMGDAAEGTTGKLPYLGRPNGDENGDVSENAAPDGEDVQS